MTLVQNQPFKNLYFLVAIKSFLIWTFTLTVCMLVIGFPAVVLVVSIGALMAVTLHAIMPFSAVLLIVVGLIGIHAIGIMSTAAFMTASGIHPQEVEWLRWLNGQADPSNTSVYAACPLTCEINA